MNTNDNNNDNDDNDNTDTNKHSNGEFNNNDYGVSRKDGSPEKKVPCYRS